MSYKFIKEKKQIFEAIKDEEKKEPKKSLKKILSSYL